MRALLKLEQVLPPRLRHRVAALASVHRASWARRGPTVDAERLSSIAGACRDHEGNSISAISRPRRRTQRPRRSEPHRLVHTGYRWYLVAWDLGRKDWRTFRVDRIEGKLKTSTRFKPRKPPEGDFAAFVSKSLSHVPYPFRARVTLHAPVETVAKSHPAFGRRTGTDRRSLLHASHRLALSGGNHHPPVDVRRRLPGARTARTYRLHSPFGGPIVASDQLNARNVQALRLGIPLTLVTRRLGLSGDILALPITRVSVDRALSRRRGRACDGVEQEKINAHENRPFRNSE